MNDLIYVGGLTAEDGGEHSHGDYEVIVFIGGGYLSVGGIKNDCPVGCAAVIPPLTPHAVGGYAVRASVGKALLPVKEALIIPESDAEQIKSAVLAAAAYTEKAGNSHKNSGVTCAYGGLIAALVADYVSPSGYSPVVRAVIDDADRHLGDATYSLEGFLRTLPLNYDYVRKLFQKETGVTPHAYLTGRRMEMARTILLSGVTNRYSEYTMTQIAEACGYAEPLYFSRVFKKYFGVAPSHYLKN